MNEAAYVFMAGRMRLVDDAALADIAQQLGTGLFALMRMLDTTGSEFGVERVRLRQELTQLRTRRERLLFLTRWTPVAEGLEKRRAGNGR